MLEPKPYPKPQANPLSPNSEQIKADQIQVFLIDDEAPIRKATSQWLSLSDMQVESFAKAEDALAKLSRDSNLVIISDIKMPSMDGLSFAQHCRAIDRDLPIILVTAHGDIQMAVNAMRDGAYDFIEKPIDPVILVDRVKKAWEKRQLVLENRRLKQWIDSRHDIENKMIGFSPEINKIRQQILTLAKTPVDSIINGATGTGKELAARCLHEFSPRAEQPFVAINCGAIPENLIESELFGHEKGAFTDAANTRIGKLEHAKGGTIFLDEIESMPLMFQVKLLRVLQERKVERLGSNQSIDLDIWVIAATKIDLNQACQEGGFREDLYYRFNIAEIHLPLLSQRPDDIPLLFNYFARKAALQFERPFIDLDDTDISLLLNYHWPGNVRQLKNIAERYVLAIEPQSLAQCLGLNQPEACSTTTHTSLQERTQAFERQIIIHSLQKHNANINAVLKDLQLPRRTLNNKMRQYEIKRSDYKSP